MNIIQPIDARGRPVREVLRAHTGHDHERMHQSSFLAALIDRELTLSEYRLLILRLYGFYQPLDLAIRRTLAEAAAEPTEFGYTARSDLLAQDLRDLGFHSEDIASAPRCDRMLGMVDKGSLGGVIYVIEGATLGGAQINRAAQHLLGPGGSDGRRYWAWCASVGRARWNAVNRYLDQLVTEGVSITDLKNGATATFRALSEWLEPLGRSAAGARGKRV